MRSSPAEAVPSLQRPAWPGFYAEGDVGAAIVLIAGGSDCTYPRPVTSDPDLLARASRGATAPVSITVGIVLALVLAVVFPVLALATVSLYAASQARSWKIQVGMCSAVVASVLGWMNSDKAPTGDWAWYTAHYRLLENLPLSDYLGSRIPPFTIRSTEPVYYSLSAALSKTTSASVPVLAFAVTALIYMPMGLAIGLFTRNLIVGGGQRVLMVLTGLSVGISFTLSTHLVRQEIGAAVALLGATLLLARRLKSGLLALFSGVLTHNSVLVPACVLLVAAVFVVRDGRIRRNRLSLLGVAILGLAFGSTRLAATATYGSKDDGYVSPVVLVVDVVLLLLLFRARRGVPSKFLAPINIVLTFSILQLCLVIGLYPQPIPSLRMYLYLEAVRGLTVAFLVGMHFANSQQQANRLLNGPILLMVALFAVEARIVSSPFIYAGGGLIAHLARPLLLPAFG